MREHGQSREVKGSSPATYHPAWLPVLCKVAGVFVIALSCVVLLGWTLGLPQMIRVVPAMVSMNPLTAIVLILAGSSLWRIITHPAQINPSVADQHASCHWKRDRIAVVLAVIVLVVGAVMMADYLFKLGWGIDRILFSARFRDVGRFPPSELAPNTAFNFFLCGLGLLLFDVENDRGFRPGQALVLAAGLIALLALIGYCYRILSWYQLGAHMPMSLESALAFAAFAVGYLAATPDRGFMTVLTSRTPGGTIARRLLPMAIIVPWILGALLFAGEQRGYYPDEFSLSIFAVLSIVIFTFLIWWHARMLYVADLERVQVARRLAVQHSATRVLAETLDEREVMPRILRAICETLEWRAGLIWNVDTKAGALRCAEVWPDPANSAGDLAQFLETSRATAFQKGQGLPGRVWEKQKTAWIKDVTKDAAFPRTSLAAKAALYGALGVPILIGGEVLGVMEFFSSHVEPPDEELLDVLGTAGIQLGQFLERQRSQAQLREATANLERSNTDLQQFVYVASHDLFEPLRMVISYLQLLTDHEKGKLDKEAHEFIGFAVDGAERMLALINDLLAYSRVDMRTRPFEVFSAEDAFLAATANLKVAVEENHATVTHDPLPKIRGDIVQLTQLFQNLVGNAIKFHGPAPPHVHVSAQQKNGKWLFSVRDNGIGIDPKYFERIFVIFQRLHARHEYPGTGMGLAICKKIVERHGGEITLESKRGEGSTFFFTLPVVRES